MSDEKTHGRPTYAEAAGELEAILQQIETGAADIDVLSDKVQRAAVLIKACRDKLASTEVRVRKVVDGLAAEVPAPAAPGAGRGIDNAAAESGDTGSGG